MRVLIGVIIVVIAIIGVWLYTFDSIEDYTTVMTKDLDTLESTIQDNNWEIASNQFESIKAKWNKTRKIWTVLLDHHEIDNIDLSMSKAEKYILSKDLPLTLGEVETLRQLFLIVQENESLTLTNIL